MLLITTSLLDLLPQTYRLAASVNVLIEDVMALTVVGLIVLYVISRVISHHVFNDEGEYVEVKHPLCGLFATSKLSVHSLIDCLAIGFGFQTDLHVGIIVAIAVIFYDLTDVPSTVIVMLNPGNSLRNSLRMLFLDAVTPILGAVVAPFIVAQQYYMVLLLPFFARGFPYLGVSDLLPEAHEKNPQILAVVSCISGFALIFILTYVLSS